MPLTISFITCEPTNSVPTQPKRATYQEFTSGRNTCADSELRAARGKNRRNADSDLLTALPFQGALHCRPGYFKIKGTLTDSIQDRKAPILAAQLLKETTVK